MAEILIWRTDAAGKTWSEAADEFARDWPIDGPKRRGWLQLGIFKIPGEPYRYRIERHGDTFRVWRSPA